MKARTLCGELRTEHADQKILLYGWVHRRRDHGGLIFIDLRDASGLVQVLFSPEKEKLFLVAKELRVEFVLQIEGKVRKRPPGTENRDLATGEIEVVCEDVVILNRAKTPPFEIEDETSASEEIRLAYRYLDLRRKRMQENILLRHRVAQLTRNFLDKRGFIEVETPILTKSTPEGARDYLVPSRLSPGKFYALPQSPQLFKQLLMVAGLDRYFQISRCFRDEDLRADRQPEFTQVDIELSFSDEETIFDLVKELLTEIFGRSQRLIGKDLALSFARMTYQEAMARYGADSPDIRFGLELQDVTDLLRNCGFEKFMAALRDRRGGIFGINVPSGARFSESQLDVLRGTAQERGAKDLAHFKYEKGSLASHISKHFEKSSLQRVQEKLGSQEGDLVLMVADKDAQIARGAMGRVRDHLKERTFLPELLQGKERACAFVWMTDFPLFEKDEEGNLTTSHHPFTGAREEDIPLLSSTAEDDLFKIRSHAYDIVLNGVELGSGSIRIHRRDVQEKVFKALKLSPQEQEARFGFLLEAFSYGAPPHGGIALGLDRLVAMLVDLRDGKFSDTEEATSIREVIAFPKTQRGICPLTVAPSDIPKEKLKELGLHG